MLSIKWRKTPLKKEKVWLEKGFKCCQNDGEKWVFKQCYQFTFSVMVLHFTSGFYQFNSKTINDLGCLWIHLWNVMNI